MRRTLVIGVLIVVVLALVARVADPSSTVSKPERPNHAPAIVLQPTRSAPGRFWNGDFSTGNFRQYSSFLADHPDGNPADFTLVRTDPPPPHDFKYAFKATLGAGDGSVVPGEAGQRTLLTLWPGNGNGSTVTQDEGWTRGYQGANTWYRDEVYFPPSFQASRGTDFNWVYELHNYPDDEGGAMLSCGVDTSRQRRSPFSDGGGHGRAASPARFSCRIFGGGSPADPFDNYDSSNWYRNPAVDWDYMIGMRRLVTGQWLDMVWNIDWDWRSTADAGNGYVSWWINGKLVGFYRGPTLLYLSNAPGTSGGGANQAYLQTGYYRPDDSEAGYAQPTASVYHAGTMIGPTAAAIGERCVGQGALIPGTRCGPR